MPGSANRFLSVLSQANRQRLLSLAEQVALPKLFCLCREGVVPEFVFLLQSGLASQVIGAGVHREVEVGVVGRDGGTGFECLLGATLPVSRASMLAEGVGYRIAFADFRESFLHSAEIRARVLEFVQKQAVSATYLSACNKLHTTEARLARWLLTTSDLLESDTLASTQELLGQMLGVQRTAVGLVAGFLQRTGALAYQRGRLEILDREALAAMACPCYSMLKRLNEDLFRERSG